MKQAIICNSKYPRDIFQGKVLILKSFVEKKKIFKFELSPAILL